MEYKHLDKIGVLITSHPKHHVFLGQALASWQDYPGYILFGYDDKNLDEIPMKDFMPPITETFATGYDAGTIGHFRGELLQMQMGAKIIGNKNLKYIYKTCGDTACYKWRNLDRMVNLIEGKNHYDIILCGTAVFFARVEVLQKCMELFHLKLKSGGAELYLDSQIRKFGFKDYRQKSPFWEEVLGRIHIQGEYAINTGKTIIDTWKIGQLWGKPFKHKDIVDNKQWIN